MLWDELLCSLESFRMGAGLRPMKGPIKGLELRAMWGQPDLPENSGPQSSAEFSGWWTHWLPEEYALIQKVYIISETLPYTSPHLTGPLDLYPL